MITWNVFHNKWHVLIGLLLYGIQKFLDNSQIFVGIESKYKNDRQFIIFFRGFLTTTSLSQTTQDPAIKPEALKENICTGTHSNHKLSPSHRDFMKFP